MYIMITISIADDIDLNSFFIDSQGNLLKSG